MQDSQVLVEVLPKWVVGHEDIHALADKNLPVLQDKQFVLEDEQVKHDESHVRH